MEAYALEVISLNSTTYIFQGVRLTTHCQGIDKSKS